MLKVNVTILICTCNRAASLLRTIAAIDSLEVPAGVNAELLIVDNGSNDDTAKVVKASKLRSIRLRYVFEGKKGKSSAYNSGLALAGGEVFLCTDDDIIPSPNWISGMCSPIVEDRADVVQGGIRIAPELDRPGLKGHLRMMMASTDMMKAGDRVIGLCGANMAFSRRILSQVPAFDPELGPGALGFGEETLLMLQIQKAGYRIVPAWDVLVEHHFDPSRINRAHILQMAIRYGWSRAYIDYHWKHGQIHRLGAKSLWTAAKLIARRMLNPRTWGNSKALEWETSYVCRLAYLRQFRILQVSPRNYTQFGLTKKNMRFQNGSNSFPGVSTPLDTRRSHGAS
jgi:glucosyl-dolichyl phosphate glucuronosyltransferase